MDCYALKRMTSGSPKRSKSCFCLFKESFQEFNFAVLMRRRIGFVFAAEQRFSNVPGKSIHIGQIRIA